MTSQSWKNVTNRTGDEMTCQHDPTFRIENEANGGAGCPLCNREWREQHMPTLGKRVVMVQHDDNKQEIAPDWVRPGYIINQAATLWNWMGDDTITTGEIAALEARCAETDSEEDGR